MLKYLHKIHTNNTTDLHLFYTNDIIGVGDNMKRKIYSELIDWKNSNSKQSLLIKGSRQVGKTYIIKEFGKNEFSNLLYINFENQKDLLSSFGNAKNPDEAIALLKTYGISKSIFDINKIQTLIFLDEIQLCKRMYSLLKPLSELDEFRIIVSGSLLGLNIGGDYLDPGPIVKHITMHPMDFEEFLWSRLGKGIKTTLKQIRLRILNGDLMDSSMHILLNKHIKEYIIIGGMPQVVQTFITNLDYGQAFIVQSSIINLYKNDIQQYQKSNDLKVKTQQCFEAIPLQFAKDNHKFQYMVALKGGNARHFSSSIDWLEKTGNVNKCYIVDHLRGSLVNGKGNSFKLFMNDIGLLVNLLGKEYVHRIQQNELGLFKGALYEQLISQMLISKEELLYYVTPGSYEIDFLLERNGKIYPLECKSGGNTKSQSLKNYIKIYKPIKAYKISLNNINTSNKVMKAIPHYAFALISIDELLML